MGNAKQMASAGARFSAVLWCAAMLGACGGGDDSGNGSASRLGIGSGIASGIYYVPPPSVAMMSQADNLKNYLGTWVSECGQVVDTTNASGIKSGINTYTLTALSDKTITGKFTQQQFSGMSCFGSQLPGYPTFRTVELTFKEKIQTPNSAKVGNAIAYVGAADKMEQVMFIIKDQMTIPDSIDTQFFTMGSDNQLRVNANGNFNSSDLRYTKQ
jgi:hypothetical protein